jgi:hypothetical protein
MTMAACVADPKKSANYDTAGLETKNATDRPLRPHSRLPTQSSAMRF